MANGGGGFTNFGMQPQGAAADDERPEGASMTDRPHADKQPRSQQEVQMGEKAPQPGERAEVGAQEQTGGTQAQGQDQASQRRSTPMDQGSEGAEAPTGGRG